ncbi:MAG: hypothetical protein INH34_13055 [Phycisphaerales bacterium]|nr:hypothetical protein [Phycisphaerales bacterium]
MKPALARVVLSLGVGLFASTLAAQGCGIKAHFQLLNTVPGGSGGDLRLDSGWQTTAPLVMPGTNSQSSPQGCYSTATCTSVADYGALRVFGSGDAASCGAGGCFLKLDEWTGAEPKARFRDTLTVVAPGLAPGTPVQVRFSAQLGGFASVGGTPPFTSYFGVRMHCNSQPIFNLANSVGATSATVTVLVGQSVSVEGMLDASLMAIGVMSFNATGSYALDLSATFDITSLTPGVALQSCSGATYNGLAARVTPVGVGCGAVPPALTASAPTLGGNVAMSLTGAPANTPVFRGMALGVGYSLPLGACMLRLDPATSVLDLVGFTSANGQLPMALPIPNSVNLLNFRLSAQALQLLTGGPFLGVSELSNSIELQIGY